MNAPAAMASGPIDLSPPRERRWTLPLLLALLAHAALIAALTWGVSWRRESPVLALEAELWSALPQLAAPRAAEPEAPPPAPTPTPAPEPAKAVTPAPPAPAPVADAQIATERQRQADKARAEKEAALKDKAAKERAAKEKAAAEKAAAEKAAADKRRRELADKREAERQQAQIEADRRKTLERLMGQAGATGAPGSTGTAAAASAPSANYAGKVVARIRPNIVFPDTIAGNPRAEVEVRTLPDGTIIGRRLARPSGNASWDEAVLRAIDRTGSLPRDENGNVPPALLLEFRPKD